MEWTVKGFYRRSQRLPVKPVVEIGIRRLRNEGISVLLCHDELRWFESGGRWFECSSHLPVEAGT